MNRKQSASCPLRPAFLMPAENHQGEGALSVREKTADAELATWAVPSIQNLAALGETQGKLYGYQE